MKREANMEPIMNKRIEEPRNCFPSWLVWNFQNSRAQLACQAVRLKWDRLTEEPPRIKSSVILGIVRIAKKHKYFIWTHVSTCRRPQNFITSVLFYLNWIKKGKCVSKSKRYRAEDLNMCSNGTNVISCQTESQICAKESCRQISQMSWKGDSATEWLISLLPSTTIEATNPAGQS